jgi:hypothetical protein
MDERERLEMLLLLLKRVRHPRPILRPVHVVFPAMFAQMILLSISLWQKSFTAAAAGSLLIAGLVMLPSAFPQKQRVSFHWIKAS